MRERTQGMRQGIDEQGEEPEGQGQRMRPPCSPSHVIPIIGILLGHAAAGNLPRAEETASFRDPFAYCAVVGTADAPGPRYTGPATPAAIARGLQAALGAPADAPLAPFLERSVWRCMDGKVYACSFGANLPCLEKADLGQRPSTGMAEFCGNNPGAPSIPAVVTGRATVYQWRCQGGTPTVAKQVFRVDDRGYLADIWHVIAPR
jgi:hypothetical protein